MNYKNLLFVAKKPMFITSNKFLNSLKKKYGTKKMGFSGTLDPFACGNLIIASGQYTKLFNYLKKTPKEYIATLFLGANSTTLDIEKIDNIEIVKNFEKEQIIEVLNSFLGKQKQIPPKYSAKRIDGKRAYELARSNEEFKLKEIDIEIFEIELINYSHPFVTFRALVSEGTFIRSLGNDIAKRLGVNGSLTYLERTKEGNFFYECEKKLNPLEYLDLKENFTKTPQKFILGQKLSLNNLEIKEKGKYFVKYDNFFAIIEIDEKIKYLLNRIELC